MQNLENEQTLCNTALNKLEALCRENQLTYLFQSDAYPFLQFYWASVKHGFAPPTNMLRLTD